MYGLMQRHPLLISSMIAFAEREHGAQEIVSRTADGTLFRYTYADAARRARHLSQALLAMGVKMGDRVATLAWNGFRHLEAYYGISGIGAVCHTINPRLYPAQARYIMENASDVVLFIDADLVYLLQDLDPAPSGVRTVVIMTDAGHMPSGVKLGNAEIVCYESLFENRSDPYEWPSFDENSAAGLCYTSGTTGHPKGVLYSHRSVVLHTYAICLPDAFGFRAMDVVMPVVPMFHVMAWGIPYAATVVGAKLVLPGPRLDGSSLHNLMKLENVTLAAGVPTVWLDLLNHMRRSGEKLPSVQRVVSGGAAVASATVDELTRYGIQVQHAWGMTELSPLAGVNSAKPGTPGWKDQAYADFQNRQGRPPFGIEIKAVDEHGAEAPRDGIAVGAIRVRGHWVLSRYFGMEDVPILDEEGWFETGDVGSIDSNGYLRIMDRTKDLIKSGGEWISSIELENIAVGHPGIAEAAVVAVPNQNWGERPLLLCVRKDGGAATSEEIRRFYEGKVAKWWVPDEVIFVQALPHTGTGKLDKVKIREQISNGEMAGA